MIQWFYRFVKGWLKIELYGKDVTRFLNLCSKHGIDFWNLACIDSEHVSCCISLGSIYNLRPFLRKTKVRMRIILRKGMPFLMFRYRKRKIFFAILAAMLVFTTILSTRIWRIEIIGNTSIGEETLLSYLRKHDISYGTQKESIDNDAMELSLRQDFDPIIWASVYEEGTKLVVCVQEKIASDRIEPEETTGYTDLVAKQDAVVSSIITRNGVPLVKAKDKVKAGDILVCARQEILDDNGEVKEYFYQNADADVIGKVTYDYEDWIPQTRILSKSTGRTHTRYCVRMLNRQVITPDLYAAFSDSESIEDMQQLCLMENFYLPVYVGKITEYEQEKEKETISMKAAKDIAIKNLDQFLDNLEENGVSIIDKNVMIEKIDKKYHVYGKIRACKDITKTAPTEMKTISKEPEEKQDEVQTSREGNNE